MNDFDAYLFHEGTNYELYRILGAHPCRSAPGTLFRVWAPNAKSVSVLSGCNSWNPAVSPMRPCKDGTWELYMDNIFPGDTYRYAVTGADGILRYKTDPLGFSTELRPSNASVVCEESSFAWTDAAYLEQLKDKDVLNAPMAIYEVHPGSWKKDYRLNKDGFLNYRTLADQLSEYVCYMGFTHVELMGICEYPFDGSWGYQVTGYFSPTSRHGRPDDFRYFVDKMHACGIGVILDWVPAHFPKDTFSLENFDGTPLYESADPLLAEYPEWGTKAFDHSKPEVRSFLISSAFYWIREFHIDALRVDAVAAMFYTSYSRTNWRPNRYGGTDNLESIAFLQQLNQAVCSLTHGWLIAEDSSIKSGVTLPVEKGGIGFRFKWSLGWMNDTLRYFEKDPLYRRYHHEDLTRTFDYAYTENFVLVLSHDEVVHLKHSMVEKMPGFMPDKIGDLKSLYTLQFTHPGKKLLFMGQEFAEDREWDENREISWQYAEEPWHRDVLQCIRKLLKIYRNYACLYADSSNSVTCEWVNRYDRDRNILSYIRRNPWNYDGALLVVLNLSPVSYDDYSCGVPLSGLYPRIFSTYDSLPVSEYRNEGPAGDSGQTDSCSEPVSVSVAVTAEEAPCDHYSHRLSFGLRPHEAVIFALPDIPDSGNSSV